MMVSSLLFLKGLGLCIGQLAFGFTVGALFYWSFRKLRARLQARRGPPWYQIFADILKLLSKENVIPLIANRPIFTLAPLLSFTGYLVVLFSIPIAGIQLIPGDLIVILVFLMLSRIAIILAGTGSGSPYGAIWSSRETVLLVASEVPFVVSAAITAAHVHSLDIMKIVEVQYQSQPFVMHYPFATAAFIICALVTLGRKPFDIPDADVEIIAGPYTEYSGPLLAFFEISNVLKWFVIPALAVDLFFAGGFGNIMIFLGLSFCIVVLISFVDAQNPRYRVDEAFKVLIMWATALVIVDLLRVTTGYLLW